MSPPVGDHSLYDIYVAFGRQQFPEDPVHWLIVLVHPGSDRCMRLHCEGWPGRWEVAIESNKRFESWWIETKFYIGRIPAEAGTIVEEELKAIPPQSAQIWVLYALLCLEKRELVPVGTYEHWKSIHVGTPSDEDFGPGPFPDQQIDESPSDEAM